MYCSDKLNVYIDVQSEALCMDDIILIIIAYVLGSIPSALWVGKIFYNKDIRQYGSGNLGATNTFRVLGKKAGFVVTLIDIFKGTAATLLPLLAVFDGSQLNPLIIGMFAVIGHMFPIFAKFKGGKAVATSGGVILGYHWAFFVVVLAAFFIVLKLSKMVSFSSMAVAVVGFIYSVIYFIVTKDFYLLTVVLALVFFIFYRHRDNISRIKAGTEPKITWL